MQGTGSVSVFNGPIRHHKGGLSTFSTHRSLGEAILSLLFVPGKQVWVGGIKFVASRWLVEGGKGLFLTSMISSVKGAGDSLFLFTFSLVAEHDIIPLPVRRIGLCWRATRAPTRVAIRPGRAIRFALYFFARPVARFAINSKTRVIKAPFFRADGRSRPDIHLRHQDNGLCRRLS